MLDLHRGTLVKGSTPVFLRPKAHALLVYLARNMGRIVPKAELMDVVWPGVYVTEDSLTQSIREIRKELDDQEQIRTVSRRGYMLVGSPRVAEEPNGRPIVAVLRFRNESGDPQREPIVDGFAEDIITGLGHSGSVTVLARNSSFQFPSQEPSAWADAASRIGADFLVEGSVRWSGEDALVSVTLVDGRKLQQLWGQRYEAHDVELFSVQREIGEQIVNRLVSRLDEATLQRAALRPAQSLEAYELVTRALAILRGQEHVEPEKALPLLEMAIARDPSYGVAYAHLAYCKFSMRRYDEVDHKALEDILLIAIRAATLAPGSAVPPRVMAVVRLYLRNHAAAEGDLRSALSLNRYDADSIEQMGYLMAMRGRPLDALAWIDRAARLNPIVPPWYHFDRALALYGLGEYQAAAEALQLPPRRQLWHRARLAACYAQLNDHERCSRELEAVFEAFPNYPLVWIAREQMPYERPEDIDHLVEGFTKALGLAGRPLGREH